MFSKFYGVLFAALFVFVSSGSVLAQDCPSGYVQPACDQEQSRSEKAGCGLFAASPITVSVNGEEAQQQTVKTANTSDDCKKLVNDLDSCKQQCIPQVTNGNILPGPKDGSTAKNYLVGNFLPNLTNGFLIFIMVLGVGFLVAAGFMWIFSAGNQELSSRALRTVIWTIIGLVVAVISYLLVQIIINISFFS